MHTHVASNLAVRASYIVINIPGLKGGIYKLSFHLLILACRAVHEVMKLLGPYTKKTGAGPLEVKQIHHKPGRSSLIITYNPYNYTDRSVGFVGSHFDVVRADPKNWKTPPFQLTRLEVVI